jgi:hypothetical protein
MPQQHKAVFILTGRADIGILAGDDATTKKLLEEAPV